MKFSRDSLILLATFAFLVIGTVVVCLTHKVPDQQIVVQNAINEPRILVGLPFDSQDHPEYIEQIRPIIVSLGANISLENVKKIRASLLAFESQDSGVGKVHVNLYLAFVDMEKYLVDKDDQAKENALTKLNLISTWLPELEIEIDNLTKHLVNG